MTVMVIIMTQHDIQNPVFATVDVDVEDINIDADQSSYEEIAGVISNKDDPNMLCLTFRTWLIGLVFTTLQLITKEYFQY
ncbi:unnamed protein product, partial [Didymodactylos carnosus]